jgi:phosphoglycerate dehydrogenase-like enzyme
VLGESDVVVVLLPLTSATRGSLGAAQLARMKPGAYLVNLARGGIVDEAALHDALLSSRLGGAAFDVFAGEPLSASSPLWDAPNFWITPHVAGGFPELLETSIALFAENVARLERGEPVASAVDLAREY